jgi:pimeloyl-ACP methyl ester carboxylesterase
VPVPARLPKVIVIVYLHGFASSAQSTKGRYLGERLLEHGITLRCPNFNEPDFASLTMTRMLDRLEQELKAAGPDPIALIGSSLGGTLAVLAAARFAARVDRLVLLAPAVMFAKAGHHLLPPERVAEWQRKGTLPFFHYGDGAERPLNFAFYEDSLHYDAFNTRFTQPALVFQGQRDTSVDPRTVELFARDRPNVTLALLEDDHQLVASLPRMWNDMQPFLGLTD